MKNICNERCIPICVDRNIIRCRFRLANHPKRSIPYNQYITKARRGDQAKRTSSKKAIIENQAGRRWIKFMNADVEKIVSDVLELPPAIRAFIAEKLIESLDTDSDEPLSSEWKAEVSRRGEEIDSGAAQLRDAESVFEKAAKALS